MPHYKDGTEVKLLDEVVGPSWVAPVTGVVLNVTEGATSCNVLVGVARAKSYYSWRDGKSVETHKVPALVEEMFTASDLERSDLHAKRVTSEAKA